MGWDGREKTEKGKGMTAVGEEKKGRQNGGKREYESEIKARKGKGKEQRQRGGKKGQKGQAG